MQIHGLKLFSTKRGDFLKTTTRKGSAFRMYVRSMERPLLTGQLFTKNQLKQWRLGIIDFVMLDELISEDQLLMKMQCIWVMSWCIFDILIIIDDWCLSWVIIFVRCLNQSALWCRQMWRHISRRIGSTTMEITLPSRSSWKSVAKTPEEKDSLITELISSTKESGIPPKTQTLQRQKLRRFPSKRYKCSHIP